jgi:cell division protein FtsN
MTHPYLNRDYKTPLYSGKKTGTLFFGMFIGYVLGLLTAMGTWMYMSQAPSPFISQDKLAEGSANGDAADKSEKEGEAADIEDKTAKAPDSKPRFEFYNILPSTTEEPVTEQQLKQVAKQPTSQDKYFLQAGAFQNPDDADNMKAKLAMLGVEAAVQTAEVPQKGLWHRVRVGPFSNVDDMNRIRASLQQNGVQTSPVRVHEGA